MIDPITEDILLEAKAIESLKKILPQIKTVMMRKDIKGMLRLAKQLPQKKNFKQIKNEALKLPNFRQRYAEAKRAIVRSKVLDSSVHEPASVAVAIIALNTNMKVSEIIKAGDKGVLQSSMLLNLIPGGVFIMPILKLTLFLSVITAFLIVGGGVIIPAATIFAKGVGYILSIISNGLKSIGKFGLKTADVSVTKTDVVNTLLGTKIQPDTFEQIGKAMETHPPGTAGLLFKRKK